MPFDTTQVEQGQVAGLNMALNPIRAQEEAKRLPLETQDLQNKVANDALKTQADTLKIKSMFADEAASAKAKSAIQSFYLDPANKTMSVPDQQEALAKIVMGEGNFKLGETFLDHAEKARERLDRQETLKLAQEDHAQERIHSYLTSITPDNIDQTLMAMQKDGVMKPEQAAQLALHAHKAAMAGGDTFDKWKNESLDTFNSVKAKSELAKEEQYKNQNRLAQERIEAQDHRAELTNNRLIAAIASKDDSNVDKVSTDLYKTGLSTYRDANIVLRNNAKARAELGKDPGKASWGSDSDAKVEWDKKNLELKQEEDQAKDDRDNARADMTKARSLMSPKIRAALGDIPRDKPADKESKPLAADAFNKKWATLEPGESLVGPDGKTYTKKAK